VGKTAAGADLAAPPPPLFSVSLTSSSRVRTQQSRNGRPWRPEKGGDSAAAGPLAGVRARPRVSATPSSGLVVVHYTLSPKWRRRCARGVAERRPAAARAFLPRDVKATAGGVDGDR
jgi:hypothetical protein